MAFRREDNAGALWSGRTESHPFRPGCTYRADGFGRCARRVRMVEGESAKETHPRSGITAPHKYII